MGYHQKPWSASEDAVIRAHLEYNRGRFDLRSFQGLPGRSDSAVASRAVRLRGTAPSRAGHTIPAPAPDIPVEWDEPDEKTEPGLSNDADELLARLAQLTRRGPITIEALCDALDRPPKRIRELVDEGRERGMRVEIDGNHIGIRPTSHATPLPEPSTVHVSAEGERRIVALVGDIHFGSKHHLSAQFQDYCRYAYERGARTFLHVGDLLDGVYRHSVWEQSARGFEDQARVAVEELPHWHDAKWLFILGNHDETFGETSGMDVGRAIEQTFRAAGRNDLTYLGPRAAYVRLVAPGDRRGLFVELWHPRDKSNAYAKSYRLQKRIEAYPPGSKPDVLAGGHWHQSIYVPIRGVHAMSTGCWQGSQSSFGKSLSGSPDIGSWIIEYAMTPEGTVRTFLPEWRQYFEHETVRDVALG